MGFPRVGSSPAPARRLAKPMGSPGVLSVILTGMTSKQARLATERLLQEILLGGLGERRSWASKRKMQIMQEHVQ